MELDKRDFKKAVRGYSEDEVDFFLAKIRADYEALYKENQDIKTQLDDYEQNVGKYKALENTLNNTLIVAQQTAEDLKRNAEKAAELILEEAKLRAQQRIHEAEAEVRKLGLQKEDLLKRIQEVKIRLRAFLRAQLDLLDDSADVENAPTTSQPIKSEIKAATEITATEANSIEEKTAEVDTTAEAPKTDAPKEAISVNYSWSRDAEATDVQPEEQKTKNEEI